MAGKTCAICGKPSGMYPLCMSCMKEKNNGNVVKCEKCGAWHRASETCICSAQAAKAPEPAKTETIKSSVGIGQCIICGESAPNGSLCKKCWYEMTEYKDTFNKNSKVFEFKDHYFNLKSNIYRMTNFDYVQSNCNRLMALAVLTKELFNDESLFDRIINDIKDIIESKRPKEYRKQSEYSKKQDSEKEQIIRSFDGHYVKSDMESIVDDILYDLRIVHCYEKKVPINADEQALKADWYIPITDARHGIYIEYWGMNTPKYLENKERKRKAYKEHNIPLIEIEKDDPKDRQGLSDRIVSEINTLAKKHFGVSDYLK